MKRYIQWLSVMFLAVLLVGCESRAGLLPKVSSSVKKEIEEAWPWDVSNLIWYDESDSDTWAEGIRYYGTFGNVVALYRGGSSEYGGIDNGLVFYSNGKLYSLDSAIVAAKEDAGMITMEDIQNASDFHKTFSLTTEKKGSVFIHEGSEGVDELPAELQREVERVWWEAENYELSWTRKRNDIRYYGNYDGTVVIYTDLSNVDVWHEITIGGVTIGDGNFSLYAYRDGELVPVLEDVYTNGWLTEENLKTIAKYHRLCEARELQ